MSVKISRKERRSAAVTVALVYLTFTLGPVIFGVVLHALTQR